MEKEKRDNATNAKVSSLTRGLDGRIVMNIKEEDKRRPKATHRTRKKRKEDAQPEAGGGSKYLGEVYSEVTPDQVDTRLSRPDTRLSRPDSRKSSRSKRRSKSRDSRRSERKEGSRERGRSERRSRRSSRRESRVR